MFPLEYTVGLTLKQIYGYKEVQTKISRKDMKNLLLNVSKTFTSHLEITFTNQYMMLL